MSFLNQSSTYRGLISLAVSLGLLNISPEAQDQAVTVALQVIAAGQALIGLINLFRNEHAKPKGPSA